MLTQKEEIKIDRPIERVFSVATRYPMFVTFFSDKQVIVARPDSIEVSVGMKFSLFKIKWKGYGVIYKDTAIDFVQTEGILRGMRALWEFRPMGNSVLASITTTISIGIPTIGRYVESLLGTLLVKRTTARILFELKREAESS